MLWFQIHHCCFTKEKLLLEKTHGRFLIVLQLKTFPLPGGLHLLKSDDTILMEKTNEHPGKNSWLINLCLLFTLQQSKPEISTWTTESDVQGFRV
jgi:hypothetical protein